MGGSESFYFLDVIKIGRGWVNIFEVNQIDTIKNKINSEDKNGNGFKASTNFDRREHWDEGVDVEILTADAYISSKANSWDDFNFGVGETATGAGISGDLGTDLFGNFSQSIADAGETYMPLNVHGDMGVGAGASVTLSNEVVGYREDGSKITQGTFALDFFFIAFSISITY